MATKTYKDSPQIRTQWENWMVAQIIMAPTLKDRVLMMDKFLAEMEEEEGMSDQDWHDSNEDIWSEEE